MTTFTNNDEFNMTDFDMSFLASPEAANMDMDKLFERIPEPQATGDDETYGDNTTAAIAPPAQGSNPSPEFWSAHNTMLLEDGMSVTGDNNELWAKFAELRPALVGLWESGQLSFETAATAIPEASYQYPAPSTPSTQQQGYAYPQDQTMASPYPTPTTYQPSAASTPGPARTPTPMVGAKRKCGAVKAPATSLPPFQPHPDLSSAAAAREYMSRFDPSEAQQLNVAADDVEDVKNNIQAYAARVYDALLHPYDTGADADDGKDKYTDQQESAMVALHKVLSTPAQLKAAQACSILLVDTAIALHSTGVSLERFRKHSAATLRDLKPDDAYKISTDLVCSQRVEKMIQAVESNKLIAKDVLEQKNFLRFAECPEGYLARKMQYLRSNKTRQDKVNERAKADEAAGIRGRGRLVKRKRVEYGYDDGEDEEFVP